MDHHHTPARPTAFLEPLLLGAVAIYMIAVIVQSSTAALFPLLSSDTRHLISAGLRERQCLTLQLHSALPPRVSVYFGSQKSGLTQMLLELNNNWAHPVSSVTSAHWEVTVVRSPTHQVCDRVALRVAPTS